MSSRDKYTQQILDFAARAIANGQGDDFFASGQLAYLIDHYRRQRNLDAEKTVVRVLLRSGDEFNITDLLVAKEGWLMFETEENERVFVPRFDIARITASERTTARAGQVGFSSGMAPTPEDDAAS